MPNEGGTWVMYGVSEEDPCCIHTVEQLMDFIDEKDIGDIDVLVSLAESVGLDGKEYREALEKGSYAILQQNLSHYARNVLRPKGIPAIYIDGQKVTLSDYSVEEMMGILLNKTQPEGAVGMSCGIDGCC